MSSPGTYDEEEKERHQKCAGVVKGVHAKLRKQFKLNGDFEQVWRNHCQDHTALTQYATAMHSLACDHWSKNPETRIDWCHSVCLEYFLKDGFQKCIDKDKRRRDFEKLHKSEEQSTLLTSPSPVVITSTDGVCTTEADDDAGLMISYTAFESCKDLHAVQELKDSGADSSVGPGGEVGTNMAHADSCNVSDSDDHDLTHFAVSTFDLRETGDGKHGCPADIEAQKPDAKCRTFLENQHFSVSDLPKDSGMTGSAITEEASEEVEHDVNLFQDFDKETIYAKYGEAKYNTVNVPFKGKIRLLDVGSCFNPFLDFNEFLAIGIDISPAVESVHYCDFLHLELTEALQLAGDTVDTLLHSLTGPVERLPRSAFHVVVFSLLLEYFPSPYQRWLCCQKAHQLLALNGLLLIITPDSHHVNRNAPMMKSWKIVIESFGFKRWKYEKLEHLHCLAFRKIALTEATDNLVGDISPEMLYIPQDNHVDEDDSADYFFATVSRTEEEEADIRDTFEELPDIENQE